MYSVDECHVVNEAFKDPRFFKNEVFFKICQKKILTPAVVVVQVMLSRLIQ